MPDLRSAGYAAGASKTIAQHTNWAEAIGTVGSAAYNVYKDVDNVLNTLAAQADEKMTRWANTALFGISGSEGEDAQGLLSRTYDQNKGNPQNLPQAYSDAFDSVINVESLMSGASVDRKDAERWMNEYAGELKTQVELIAQSNTERAGKEKALSTESSRQELIATSSSDWDDVEAQIIAGYEATGVSWIDNGSLSVEDPNNRIKVSNAFSDHNARVNIEDNIASGLSKEEAIEYGISMFREHAPTSSDPNVILSIEDTVEDLKDNLGSYYDQQYDEKRAAAVNKFDLINTELLAYMDSHNGSLTREALNDIALSHNYNPEDRFEYSAMLDTLSTFGFIGGVEETFMQEPVESEVPKTPEEKFLTAARNYVATNGDINASVLEELASENGVDITTESGAASYEKGLQIVSQTESARENRAVSEALESLLSSTSVDWENDTGIGNYNISFTSGTIDEDLTLLSASNQAALQNFNNLNNVDQGGPELTSYVTTLKPLADRIMQEYGITSPEAQNAFMEGFSGWESNIIGTKPPTAVEQDINEKYYDISLDDQSFNSYLIGKVKTREITPSYALEILDRGARQTLLKNVDQIKAPMESAIAALGLNTEDAAELRYQMLGRYGSVRDLSQAYVGIVDRSPAEVDQWITDTVNATWKVMNDNSFIRQIHGNWTKAFRDFIDDDSWEVDDYSDLVNKDASSLYTDYLDGNLMFALDGEAVGLMETALLNGEMGNVEQLRDNSAQILYGRDYKDVKDSERNILDASISIAMTEATMTRIYQNYFGENAPKAIGNWKTCRVDGKGIGYMNDGGVLVIMPFTGINSSNPTFSIYKFNHSDDEYRSVWGRTTNGNFTISVSEYAPALYSVGGLEERTKNSGAENSVYSDPEYLSAIRAAVSNREGRQ